MPSNAGTTLRSRFLKPVAGVALALAACAGLAGCGGGGGSVGGAQVTIVPDPQSLEQAPQPSTEQAPQPSAEQAPQPSAEQAPQPSAEQDPPFPAARTPTPAAPILASTPAAPDMVVLQPQFSSTNPLVGTRFTLTVWARNDGDGGSGWTRIRVYRSADATITRSDTEVKVFDVRPLAPSVSWRWRKNFPQLPGWIRGTAYYGACVDAVAGESDTTNNCSPSVRAAVREAPPDLVLESPSASPAAPALSGVFALLVKLRNAGGKNVGRTTLRFYRSTDKTITTSDTELAAQTATNLKAWTSGVWSHRLNTPRALGTYYFGMCVDAVAGESDTTNNCSSTVTVEVTHDKPNLRVISSTVGGWEGNRYLIAAGLHNIGGPSPASTLRFYRSTDKTITTSDTEVASVFVPALRSTGSQTTPRFNSGWVYVTPPSSGTHHYGACVDAPADESDTTDNCKFIYTIRR